MRFTPLLLLAAACVAVPAAAQQTRERVQAPRAAEPLTLTAAQQQQITAAIAHGRQLALIDQAGRLSTRDMLARIADPNGAGIVGWIAEPEGNTVAVTYFARVEGGAPAPAEPAAPEPTAEAPAETPATPQGDGTELAGEQAGDAPSAAELTGAMQGAATPAAAPAEPAAASTSARAPATYVAVYRAQVLGGRVSEPRVFQGDARPALTGSQARMAAARQAVNALDHASCGRNPNNMLVLPPAEADAPIAVYEITPRQEAARAPVGGQYRTMVAADGTLGTSERIGGDCQEAAVPPAPTADAQPRPVIVNARDIVLPNEIHVFLSMWTGRPVVVATGTTRVRLWGVTGEGIGELRDQPRPAPATPATTGR